MVGKPNLLTHGFVFLLGLSLGLIFTLILRSVDPTAIQWKRFENIHLKTETSKVDGAPQTSNDAIDGHHNEDNAIPQDAIAKELYRKVRVACWILTSPQNLDKKAIHVKNTWTKRCHIVVFMSSVQNDSFPTIGFNTSEGRHHLTAKTFQAFKYLYENHLKDADWFLKADDDTYVIMENLRYFLSNEDPNLPLYFGRTFVPMVKQGYASGGAGYVISREALRRFGEGGIKNKTICKRDGGYEDVEFGKCMESLGVPLKNTSDALNRPRFHCYNPEAYIHLTFDRASMRIYDLEKDRGGMENISDYAISFHYISSHRMYEMEFFIYHLRPYGILNTPQNLNVKS
ncbi:unnamed protein product [Lymnaea stagnalis]|uniref:Glycoprotein-N-acetylgalactosamine 3-beta-galactosyltransferase 1 n=1 Tax=Lymnaea stagnalis TaxID=6523 RepID=A0AAV2HYI8_LYMST